MSKKLVAYFSASGVTAGIAKSIAETTGADMYEIKPVVAYTEADLNWRDENSRSSVEMKDKSFRPPMADKNADIAAYDTVFIGFPIWWYVAPTIINTFLESYDFAGKEIILFATAGSSGFGKTVEELVPSCPGAAVREGVLIRRGDSNEVLEAWLKTL